MNSLFVKDFRFGLDTRKSELTQKPGSLEVLTNGFVNQGGEIQNRKAFVRTAGIAGTFGLQSTAAGLYTFGSGDLSASHPVNIGTVGIPIYVNYQRLRHPAVLFDAALYNASLHDMTAVVFSEAYRGKAVVIAMFADGKSFGYYDGSLMRDFTDGLILAHLSTNTLIADEIEDMIDRTSAYTATKPSATTVEITGPLGQAYSTVVAITTVAGTLTGVKTSDPTNPTEARQSVGSFAVTAGSSSAGVNKITNIEIGPNGGSFVSIMGATDVDWTTSNEVTAGLLAASINGLTSSPDYTAEATGNVVAIKNITADGDGSNNYVVRVTAAGDVCIGKVQFLFAAVAGFSISSVKAGGTELITATPIAWTGTTQGMAAAVATDINSGTSAGLTHGFVANATGSILTISKAVTRSDDADIPVFVTGATFGPGNGVFEVGEPTTGPSLAASLVITGRAYAASHKRTIIYYFSVNIIGGQPPYQTPQWFGTGTTVSGLGTQGVQSISGNDYYIIGNTNGSNTATYETLLATSVPPPIYAIIVDSLGVRHTTNQLV